MAPEVPNDVERFIRTYRCSCKRKVLLYNFVHFLFAKLFFKFCFYFRIELKDFFCYHSFTKKK